MYLLLSIKVLIAAVLVVTQTTNVSSVEVESRIVGGQTTDIRSAPHMIQLRYKSNDGLVCGGTLVTPEFVITAAHCFDFTGHESMVVVAGVSTITEQGEQRDIVGFYKPTTYKRETMHTDVAVLKLDSPLPLGPKIKPIPLTSKPWQIDNMLKVTGWGRTASDAEISNQLRTVSLRMLSHTECVYRNRLGVTPITNTMECAFAPNKDSCQYDSGGPGVVNGELVGVVSWGYGCAYENYPGVYTSIYAMRSFIDGALKH